MPWFCCPFQVANTSITITADLSCNDPGAVYGAVAFWTMQATSVVGLVLALASLANCAAATIGMNVSQSTSLQSFMVPLNVELPNLGVKLSDFESWLQKDEDANLQLVKKKVIDVLKEKYRLELLKERFKAKTEEEEGEEWAESTTTTTVEEATEQGGVGLLEEVLAENGTVDTEAHSRAKRQVINVRIPTLLGHVPGGDDQVVDACERNEVLVDEDGECHDLLTQGPCDDNHIVLMNPATRKGFCAPQLCPPDRVFLFSDQLCHDPREYGLCPPGRQLFSTGYGTPVCGCPDGTYEEDDDLDDDVCEPILGHISDCPAGQVFWFSDFRRPPECRPDPCKGLNLKRGPEDLPYVPALVDNKCYKVGTQPPICSSDQYYSLSLELLRGVCSSLEDAGYLVLDSDEMDTITKHYGDVVSRKDSDASSSSKPSKSSKTKITPAGTTLLRRPVIGAPVVWTQDSDDDPPPLNVGQAVVLSSKLHPANNEVEDDGHMMTLYPTHMSAFSPPLITVNGSITFLGLMAGPAPRHHRQRRAPLPFASPGSVVEPGLSACRAGARRDGNAKCRNTILPSRFPPSRPRRDAPPVGPTSSCPSGAFDLSRRCSSNKGGIASSINALGLG